MPEPIAVEQQHTLTPNQSQHICKVLRLQVGDQVRVFHPDCGEYQASIIEAQPKHTIVEIQQQIKAPPSPPPCAIHLGQVISRGDRMDYSLQKATELGVTAITPLTSIRCGVKLSPERMAKRMAHWQGVIESAVQQCGRIDVPALHQPCSTLNWVQKQQSDVCLAAVVDPSQHPDPLSIIEHASSASILIGPEGGFTSEEQGAILKTHFQAWQLGPRVLRTETAGVVALALLQARFGDF
jgi:16S rRNA (uracil1498-N3)-methyltransferase